MITLLEAWQRLDDNVTVLGDTEIPVEQSAGWVTAEEIRATINVAPFRNSAMDGFAVATTHLTDLPATLEIDTTLYAGDTEQTSYDEHKAVKVMTGAVVPDIYDAVIPIEDVTCDCHTVTISQPVKPGRHVRLPGEDLAVGDCVLPDRAIVTPLAIGILTSLGIERVLVIRKASVCIINTGDELVAPGQPLKPGQLYDSNGPTVQSLITPFCRSLDRRPHAADDLDELTQELQNDCDVIITTGGVSAGEKDFVPAAAQRAGWQKVFHKIAIKPGKPVFCAVKDNQLLLGLPGNPLSTAVTCALFVIPALKKMMGRSDFLPRLSDAELTGEPIKSSRSVIWPGKIRSQDDRMTATIAAKRSSAALSALLDSDGMIFQNLSKTYQLPRVQVCPWPQILT